MVVCFICLCVCVCLYNFLVWFGLFSTLNKQTKTCEDFHFVYNCILRMVKIIVTVTTRMNNYAIINFCTFIFFFRFHMLRCSFCAIPVIVPCHAMLCHDKYIDVNQEWCYQEKFILFSIDLEIWLVFARFSRLVCWFGCRFQNINSETEKPMRLYKETMMTLEISQHTGFWLRSLHFQLIWTLLSFVIFPSIFLRSSLIWALNLVWFSSIYLASWWIPPIRETH